MSDHLKEANVLLIGTGKMGREYGKVFRVLGIRFTTVGRSPTSCEEFSRLVEAPAVSGGVEAYFNGVSANSFSHAVVASDTQYAPCHCRLAMDRGIRNVLVEKPAGIHRSDVHEIQSAAHDCEAQVFVAYNRRFYASVSAIREAVAEDGGLISCYFDFTERSQQIEGLNLPNDEKRNWLLRNSSHVIDLVFHLCGTPAQWNCVSLPGSLPWTPMSRFAGSGVTQHGVTFSYHACWDGPGRWGIEFTTRSRKFVLRPLETLQVQRIGENEAQNVDLPADRDGATLKLGMVGQVKNWLIGNHGHLCSIDEHASRIEAIYERMAGFSL